MHPPTTVCEVELYYLHIYVHSHYQKAIFNKELHIVPFWKSMLNVFLSRLMCPTNTPLIVICGL
jgi:hypothetical protein